MAKSKGRKAGNITPLARRQKKGKVIRSPMAQLSDLGGVVSWSSWMDDHLPNILWACVVTGALERDEYLSLFRKIISAAREVLDGRDFVSLCHNFLSSISYEEFHAIFVPLLDNAHAAEACRVLGCLDSLPDREHWLKLLAPDCSKQPLDTLANGVVANLDHQSQEATDIRWLKVSLFVFAGRAVVPPDFVEELAEYPNKGDMRSVRPKIRAFEMSIRSIETGEEKPETVGEAEPSRFWAEMLERSPCLHRESEEVGFEPRRDVWSQLDETIGGLCDHFMDNIESTTVDPRLDGSFGIALYMLCLTVEMAHSPSSEYASGRVVLRTVVENFITLKYLSNKDDAAIWLQYRSYGSGQAVLAFLKSAFTDDRAASVDLSRLEILANEDAWMETKDIAIGNWANLNLRKMAEESGSKDVYDRYYDWSSGFVHGHWGAVRDSAFTTCLNPLHRLHRVPSPLNRMPSVVEDCCKLCNQALDIISQLYPTFKPRIRWKEAEQKA